MNEIASKNQSKIFLREAVRNDVTFFEKIYIAARREEFAVLDWDEVKIQIFLKTQFNFQTRSHQEQFPSLRKMVIEANDEPVGRLLLTDEIRLVDITILPAARNLGIGGFALNYLIDRANGENKAVSLQVLKTDSAARRFYERFEFKTVGEDDFYLIMRRERNKSPKRKIENYGYA